MRKFSSEFISGAKKYLNNDKGVFFKGMKPEPVAEENVVPAFFRRLSTQYGIVFVDPHDAVRKDQEDELAGELSSGEAVLLRGFWRTGQSSMLKALERRFGEVNTVSLSFYESNKRFKGDQVPTGDAKLFVRVEEILLLPNTELRRIAELRERRNLMLLVSAQIHPGYDDRFVEVFNGFNTHYLRPLNREEIAKVIRSPLEDSPVSITDEAIDAIAAYCGGWPTSVKGFFQTFLDNSSPFKKFKEVYDIYDVQSLTDRPLRELFGSRFGHPLAHFSRIYHEGIGGEQQKALDKIAAEGELPADELDPQAVDILLKTGLVIMTPDTQAFKMNGAFLRELIRLGLVQNFRK